MHFANEKKPHGQQVVDIYMNLTLMVPLISLVATSSCVSHDVLDAAGSDINKLDEQGLTALHWACANGQMPTMEFLVQSGADINLSGNHGENALLLSSCYGYKEIVKYLLQLGMDVNCTDEVCHVARICVLCCER